MISIFFMNLELFIYYKISLVTTLMSNILTNLLKKGIANDLNL